MKDKSYNEGSKATNMKKYFETFIKQSFLLTIHYKGATQITKLDTTGFCLIP